MISKTILLVACAFAVMLTSCTSTATTETLSGRFIMATSRRIQVDLDQPGSLNTQRVLPLAPNPKVTIAGKTQTIDKLVPQSKVRLTRNLQTHQVVRIDAQ